MRPTSIVSTYRKVKKQVPNKEAAALLVVAWAITEAAETLKDE